MSVLARFRLRRDGCCCCCDAEDAEDMATPTPTFEAGALGAAINMSDTAHTPFGDAPKWPTIAFCYLNIPPKKMDPPAGRNAINENHRPVRNGCQCSCGATEKKETR